jgi:hypothetical protein
LKDKIKNHINSDKKAKETNKKIYKEKGPNWNKYYYYWKKIIKLIWMIKLKTKTKTKTKNETKTIIIIIIIEIKKS